MCVYLETSGWDETLALSLYTGVGPALVLPVFHITGFEYSTDKSEGAFERVAEQFGEYLHAPMTPEHRALLDKGEEQLQEDFALAERMQEAQRGTLVG